MVNGWLKSGSYKNKVENLQKYVEYSVILNVQNQLIQQMLDSIVRGGIFRSEGYLFRLLFQGLRRKYKKSKRCFLCYVKGIKDKL